MNNIKLYNDDCLKVMKNLPKESIHSVISDIPYGISFSEWDVLHDNKNSALLGKSPAQNKSKLFKTRGKPKNGWSDSDKEIPLQYQIFCEKFLKECLRLLKPAGRKTIST